MSNKSSYFLLIVLFALVKNFINCQSQSILNENNILNENGQLVSPNGQYRAILQSNGNFVIYNVCNFMNKSFYFNSNF